MTLALPHTAAAAHEYIRGGTYPEAAQSAIMLYDRLRYEQMRVGETVDFAGEVGLDVGSYDGIYRPVIGALGVRRVISIEPRCVPVHRGVEEGVIPADDAFRGTLEEWVAAENPPVQGAFVFNIAQRLSNNMRFLGALSAAVVPGGVVVTTFREATSAQQFAAAVEGDAAFGMRRLHNPYASRDDPPPAELIRNRFIHLWRRES